MTLTSERHTVQNPLIRYATEAGWEYLPPEEALPMRGGEAKPFLHPVLVEQLQRLNPGVVTSVTKAEEVIRRLGAVRTDIEGNREVWEYLKGLKTVFVESERRERNLHLLEPENLTLNRFHVTDEFIFQSGARRIRADVVFLVNGIPVIIIETKSATRLEGIAEAFDQLRRYHVEAPDLMAQAQLFALTHLVQFFYGATWSLSRKTLFNWREERTQLPVHQTTLDFEMLVKSFIAPRRVLRVLTDYILFARKDGELAKIILRPHQMRATERVLQRARDPNNRRGLVWHTQGSGKTYTMLTIARRLIEMVEFQNPTVLLIVDRNELEQQLFQNLEAVGFGRVHLAYSKRHLRDLLKRDTRGLIVSMIHKFDTMPANLCTRHNVFVLVDEAHRSTGGDLGNYLMGALPNATFIGFTGTPIDRTAHGKGTFKTFGGDDPRKGDPPNRPYIDKYSIRESIEDGTTVPLHYQLAPNDLIADREAMEKDFWAAAELEGVADVEEINRVLDRAVTLTNMLKNHERVAKIAAFVAEHFKNYVKPMGFKAFLVAADREACVLYKEAIDRHLPPDWSAVVISTGHNDPPHIKRHHLSEEEETRLRKAFRKPGENPQIFIVTEKLLTGYDAPILYCMYLDKPMRDHVLLQAIARVNRPYESEDGQRKITGLILDFVGVFENLERALAFDSKDVSGVVEGIEVLQTRFEALISQGQAEYLTTENMENISANSVISAVKNDKLVEAVLERFRDKEPREVFYRFFRELEELYEILSPDPFLRPHLEDYRRLLEMYRLLRSAYEPHVVLDKSFLRKTAEIVQQHSRTDRIRELQTIYEIGPAALIALLNEEKPDTVKVFNLLKELHRLVEEQGRVAPYLLSIGERAEEIRRRFEERQIESQQALLELDDLVKQLNVAHEERQFSDLSPQAFAVEWWLRTHLIDPQQAMQVAQTMEIAFAEFPHWMTSRKQEGDLRSRLYKSMLEIGIADVVAWADAILKLLRRAAE